MEDILQIISILAPIISACTTCIIGYLLKKLKKIADKREIEEEAIRAGLVALCRDRILQGYRYYKQHNGISVQDLESMNKLYKAYHALGGNGTITTVYKKIQQFPLKEGEV